MRRWRPTCRARWRVQPAQPRPPGLLTAAAAASAAAATAGNVARLVSPRLPPPPGAAVVAALTQEKGGCAAGPGRHLQPSALRRPEGGCRARHAQGGSSRGRAAAHGYSAAAATAVPAAEPAAPPVADARAPVSGVVLVMAADAPEGAESAAEREMRTPMPVGAVNNAPAGSEEPQPGDSGGVGDGKAPTSGAQ